MYAHNSEWISLARTSSGQPAGFEIGDVQYREMALDIQNSTLSGVNSINAAQGISGFGGAYGSWGSMFNIQNNTISHVRGNSNTGSGVYFSDICMTTGVQNSKVLNNVVSGCAVGVFFIGSAYRSYAPSGPVDTLTSAL